MSFTSDLINKRRQLDSSGPSSNGPSRTTSFTSSEIQRRRDSIGVSSNQPTSLPSLSKPAVKVSEPEKEQGIFSKAREKISSVFKRPPKIEPIKLPSGQHIRISSPTLPKDFDLTPSRESAQEGKLTKQTQAKLQNFYDPASIKQRRKDIQDNIVRVARPTREGYKEPGVWGSVIESIKQSTIGLGVGFGATTEMIGNMTNSILLSGAGQRLQRKAQVILAENPEWNEEPDAKWGKVKIARLIAGAVPSILGTTAAAFLGSFAGPAGTTAAGATFAFALESGPTFKEATEAGDSEGDATKKAFAVGSVNAVLESIFPSSLFDKKKIGKEVTKELSESIFKRVVNKAKSFGVKFTKAGDLEGKTEALQQLWSNIVATSYDEDRKLWDGLLESYVGGFGSGGIVGGTLEAGEHTPQEVIDTVVGSEIQDTPEGKMLLKTALEAQQTGDNIVIGPEEEITTVEATPVAGQATSGVELADKGVYADLTNEQLDFLKDEVKNIDFTKDDRPHLSPITSLERSELKKVSVEELRQQSPNLDRALKSFEEQGTEVEEVATVKPHQQLNDLYKNADQEAVGQAHFEVMSELEVSEAGQRLFSEEGEFTGAISSTFPQWVPEELRTKKLFNSVMDGLSDPTNIQYPPNSQPRKQALYDAILSEIDSRADLDSSDIISQIKEENAKQKEEKTKPQEVADRSTEGSKREKVKQPTKKPKPPTQKPTQNIPKGFKESRVIERVKDTLQSEVDLSETIYKTLTLDDIARRAVDLVNKDPDLATDIISGNGVVPEGTTKAAILIASAEQARKAGDFKTQKDLIIQRSFMQTRHGQEIVTERLVNDLSSDRFIRDVIKVRMDKVIKKIEKDTTRAKAFTNKVKKQAEVATKKVTKRALSKIESAQKILDDLIC